MKTIMYDGCIRIGFGAFVICFNVIYLGYAVGNLVRVSKGLSFEFKSILFPLMAAHSAVLCDVVSGHYKILREIELPVVYVERPFPKSRHNAFRTNFKLRTSSIDLPQIVAYSSLLVVSSSSSTTTITNKYTFYYYY